MFLPVSGSEFSHLIPRVFRSLPPSSSVTPNGYSRLDFLFDILLVHIAFKMSPFPTNAALTSSSPSRALRYLASTRKTILSGLRCCMASSSSLFFPTISTSPCLVLLFWIYITTAYVIQRAKEAVFHPRLRNLIFQIVTSVLCVLFDHTLRHQGVWAVDMNRGI